MLLTLLTLLGIAGVYLAARRFRKISLLGDLVIGLGVGVVMESMLAYNWVYHYPYQLTVGWLPVGVVFGYGLVLMAASLLSQLWGLRGFPRLFGDTLIITAVGGGQEYFGCCVAHYWSYITPRPFVHYLVGWSLGGLMILAFMHTYRDDFERAALRLLGRRPTALGRT